MSTTNSKKKRLVHELSLQELFPNTLTDTSCVYIDKGREVSVAIEMCAEYLQSEVDSIVVLDESRRPVGIVGGYEILSHFQRNPTIESEYTTKVEQIMFKDFLQAQKETQLKNLMEKWKETRRAFAVVPNESREYSPMSARRMLEIGKRIKTDLSVSSLVKEKEIVTFHRDDSVGKILNLMLEYDIRKLVLENTNQIISDRIIIGEIAKMIKLENPPKSFLDIPVNMFKLEYIKIIRDLNLSQLCTVMDKMDNPYVMHNEIIVTPWDICLALMSDSLTQDLVELSSSVGPLRVCPHCGKVI